MTYDLLLNVLHFSASDLIKNAPFAQPVSPKQLVDKVVDLDHCSDCGHGIFYCQCGETARGQ
jgi:hypothetical protein